MNWINKSWNLLATKMNLSIRWKLIISIIIPLIVIAGIVTSITLNSIYNFASNDIQQRELSKVELYAAKLEAQLASLARVAQDTADFLSIDQNLDQQEIYALLKRNVQQSPLIFGSSIAFEPYTYHEGFRLYSPYVYKQGDNLNAIEIGKDAYDYSSGDWEWYSSSKESHHAGWTEPYFDEGAGNTLMVTYFAPIFSNSTFQGVATINISLDGLQKVTNNDLDLQLLTIQSKSGRFISHYDSNLIMNSSLQEQAALHKNAAYSEAAIKNAQGNKGVAIIKDFILDGSIIKDSMWLFYTPINATGWSLSTMVSENSTTAELRALLKLGGFGVFVMIGIVFVFVLLMSTCITKPIQVLAKAVGEVAQGKLGVPIENIDTTDEIGKLALGFNQMVQNLEQQIALQSEHHAAQQLVEKELLMARETQKSLLPTEFPPFPDRLDFELHAVNRAARHIAGDFFDFFMINSKTLIFVIADVSGKGMSAALVMAVSRTIIRNLARSGKTPAQILTEANARLIDNHKGNAFVTVFLGSYNTSTGKIIYANGGHSAALKVVTTTGETSSFGDATGTIVGMLEGVQYTNGKARLLPGEMLLLYTDGFSEARSPLGGFYGDDKIKSFLSTHALASPSILCETAITEICNYQQHNLADDITLLALKRSPTKISEFIKKLNIAKG